MRIWPNGIEKLIALALAALAGWALIEWVDVHASSIADLRVNELELAPLPRPDIAAVADAKFVMTDNFIHEGRFGVARLKFDLPDPKAADLVLFIRRVRDNYAVYVNGQLAAPAPGVLADQSTLHGYHPRLIRLLPSQLITGRNNVDILSARNGSATVLREVYFGPRTRLEPEYRHARAAVHDTAEFSAVAAAIVLLFALAMARLVRPALTLVIALTLGLLLVRLLHMLWINEPWPQVPRNVLLNVTAPLIWISCAAFINEWTGGPSAYRRWFLAAAGTCCVAIAILYAASNSRDASFLSTNVESIAGIGAICFMIWRLGRHYTNAPPTAAPEVFVAGIGLVMAGVSVATQNYYLPPLAVSSIQAEAFIQLGTLSIICFIAMGLARHGIGVYQLATLNNETLARKVEEKERELEANHALLRDQERERTLSAERSRIMRDVHDGIGSQLLGLLVQARGGSAKPEAMTAGLQAAIDDLYLVVDSLDGVDGSLETALGTFRTRIEPKCTAAGIEVIWDVDDVGNTKSLGPATVLQIYRILQEALSNAIRHGNPKRIVFSLQREANAISLSLKDDGKGFDPRAQSTGRGLANMKKRAASIRARLDVTSGETGTCVKLLLPQ